MKKILFVCAVFIVLAFALANAGAYSNESSVASEAIESAKGYVNEMSSKGIPTLRVNESLNDAIQIYNAQLALEDSNRKADYKLVMSYTALIEKVRASAVEAKDELDLFRETYEDAKKFGDLSEMEADYNAIETSFREERFEDTITLIDEGYKKISEIQAKQTTLRLFYSTTSKNLKTFFVSNWNKLISSKFYESIYFYIIVVIIIILISWSAIIKLRVNMKMKGLNLQKATLNNLIKKLQYDYFKTKKISDTEFKVKLQRFKEMIRDIDRQIPLLKETLAKLDKKSIYSDKKIKKTK